MEITREEITQFIESLTEIKQSLKMSAARGAGNHSNIKVEAGGVGPWLSTALCLVMFGMLLVLGAWMISDRMNMRDEINKLQAKDQQHDDYLAAIYVQAPQLKPKEKKESK